MLEIYPTHLLTNEQVHHIRSHWGINPHFVKRKTLRGNIVHYSLTNAFFRYCIPRTLHDVVYDLGRRHFGDSMLKVSYSIVEVVTGGPAGPWISKRKSFSCIVPLTAPTPAIANHPEVEWLSPGRLFTIGGDEWMAALTNAASAPRLFLSIHVTSRAPIRSMSTLFLLGIRKPQSPKET